MPAGTAPLRARIRHRPSGRCRGRRARPGDPAHSQAPARRRPWPARGRLARAKCRRGPGTIQAAQGRSPAPAAARLPPRRAGAARTAACRARETRAQMPAAASWLARASSRHPRIARSAAARSQDASRSRDPRDRGQPPRAARSPRAAAVAPTAQPRERATRPAAANFRRADRAAMPSAWSGRPFWMAAIARRTASSLADREMLFRRAASVICHPIGAWSSRSRSCERGERISLYYQHLCAWPNGAPPVSRYAVLDPSGRGRYGFSMPERWPSG